MFIQVLLSGVFQGFIYVLISLGLSLIYGVMGLTNFANGDFLSVAMYVALSFSLYAGLDPLLSLPMVVMLLAFLGIAIYWLIIRHVLKSSRMAQIFATFGIMIFLRGVLQFIFSADFQMVNNPILSGTMNILGTSIGRPQVVASIGALIATTIVYIFINKSRAGWALQAVSENKDAASLMGIPVQKMFILAWAIGAACVGVAGALMSEYYYIYPEVGSVFGNIAIVIVALGGFGSITGVFISGLLVGIIESLCGFYVSTAYKYLFVYALYFVFMVIRPQGIMGKKEV